METLKKSKYSWLKRKSRFLMEIRKKYLKWNHNGWIDLSTLVTKVVLRGKCIALEAPILKATKK